MDLSYAADIIRSIVAAVAAAGVLALALFAVSWRASR